MSNKFILIIKARALREVGDSLVLDAVMPHLLLKVRMLEVVANNAFTEAVRDFTLLLTYIIFCLKAAIMVYRCDQPVLRIKIKFLANRNN